MSAQIEDGGPAFPREEVRGTSSTSYEPVQPGMSLRDWFAGHALAGLMASPNLMIQPGASFADFSNAAFDLADAMLAARAKGIAA